ncbi:MAG: hypothetical protein ACKPKO_30880 [Candidatus Fonsibacter sp.]
MEETRALSTARRLASAALRVDAAANTPPKPIIIHKQTTNIYQKYTTLFRTYR